MSTYHAKVSWARGSDAFSGQQYSRGHTWHFDEGLTVPASASPHVVRAAWVVKAAVDPEEALVASLSSCHMLFFLSAASKAGLIVESYDDEASGELAPNSAGRMAMTRVMLRPTVTFSGRLPGAAEFEAMHHQAHEECYIANSVTTTVVVEPQMVQR